MGSSLKRGYLNFLLSSQYDCSPFFVGNESQTERKKGEKGPFVSINCPKTNEAAAPAAAVVVVVVVGLIVVTAAVALREQRELWPVFNCFFDGSNTNSKRLELKRPKMHLEYARGKVQEKWKGVFTSEKHVHRLFCTGRIWRSIPLRYKHHQRLYTVTAVTLVLDINRWSSSSKCASFPRSRSSSFLSPLSRPKTDSPSCYVNISITRCSFLRSSKAGWWTHGRK